MTRSMIVTEKGIGDGYVVRTVVAFVRELGNDNKKLVLKSDQESSVNAVLVRVATFLEQSPVRSSGSDGVIERKSADLPRSCAGWSNVLHD